MADPKAKSKTVVVVAVIMALVILAAYYLTHSRTSWSGVDEAVVEKIAKEHGREARAPLIDPGNGDLLLFAFLVAGAVGGFAAGYYWRDLTKKG